MTGFIKKKRRVKVKQNPTGIVCRDCGEKNPESIIASYGVCGVFCKPCWAKLSGEAME